MPHKQKIVIDINDLVKNATRSLQSTDLPGKLAILEQLAGIHLAVVAAQTDSMGCDELVKEFAKGVRIWLREAGYGKGH